MNLKYIESWVDLTQDGVHCWASILEVLNLLVLLSDSKFSSSVVYPATFCVVTQFDVNLCIILICCDGYSTMYFSVCLAYNQAATLFSEPWLPTLGGNHRHPVGLYHHFSLSFDM